MSMTKRAIAAMATFFLVVALGVPARAEDREKAKVIYYQATQHYDLGEYREALAAFKEAYRNYADPSFLFNIGLCHAQLGEKEQALRFYRTYLEKVPDSPKRDDVRRAIVSLDRALAEERAKGGPAKQAPPPEAQPEPAAPPAARASEPAAAPVAIQVSAPPAAERRTPVYKKWWLWTIVGVAAVGVGVGVGVGLAQRSPHATDFGTFTF
jgi:tetratricopeptide (TPR) repeat protein